MVILVEKKRKMTKLYVIGNGFDLWHDLKTSYTDFSIFAKETLQAVEEYYQFDLSHANPWHDFENALGTFNWSEFYNHHNHIDTEADDFRPSFVFGLEDDLSQQTDEHVGAIENCFHDWVLDIDITTAKKKMDLSEDCRFINFNYTSLLQFLYGIENSKVLHIHGNAENYDELVFGHGEAIEEEPELDENGDSNRTMFSDSEGAAQHPFYALKKQVDKILEKHAEFFNSLTSVSEIIVIGHSLNKIDLPYFKKICEITQNARWTICIFNLNDKTAYIEALVACGVQREIIRICTYPEIENAYNAM